MFLEYSDSVEGTLKLSAYVLTCKPHKLKRSGSFNIDFQKNKICRRYNPKQVLWCNHMIVWFIHNELIFQAWLWQIIAGGTHSVPCTAPLYVLVWSLSWVAVQKFIFFISVH